MTEQAFSLISQESATLAVAIAVSTLACILMWKVYGLVTANSDKQLKLIVDSNNAKSKETIAAIEKMSTAIDNLTVAQYLLMDQFAKHDLSVYGLNPSVPENLEERCAQVAKKYEQFTEAINRAIHKVEESR